MRILLVTQWFTPEPTFIGPSMAAEMARMGHEVQVVTGFPNYPDGKLYDGYRVRFLQRERVDGVDLLRVPLYPSHDDSALRRAANYTSFALSAASIGSFASRRPDVALVYQGPATIGLPAMVMRALRRIPYVLHIQDLWPETLEATGMMTSKTLLRFIGKWCDIMYRRATSIIVQSPGMKRNLICKGVPESKIHIVYNWDDETTGGLGPAAPRYSGGSPLLPNRGFNIVFAGNMGSAQALESVIDAAAILHEQYPRIRFIFIGSGMSVKGLIRQVERRALSNVEFIGRKPKSEIGFFLAEADVLLVHLKDAPLFSMTIPSKIQAYLAQGKPILAAVSGDAADLVTKAQAGLSCIPENPKSIAEAAAKLYTMAPRDLAALGANARRFYAKELSMERSVRKIISIMEAAY